MSSDYEIPRLKKHVLIALTDETRIQANIYLNIPPSGASNSQALSDFVNNSKEDYFPAHLENEQFFLINKNQILYIQETTKSQKEMTNTDFKSVMLYFPHAKIKVDLHFNLLEHEQRLTDALNQQEKFLHCYQYDCLSFINKKHVVKVTQFDTE